ncbi:exosome complex component RRP45A isoform X2 [Lactuca sativa]|uniref:exosome complex component RRP45A isoform X2 n=1 Tax=Lactuca sativa TaxID=4236 RepID=UPI000CD8A455|nr:exosome complex component RRP45A isoform X2 [Lactuca sativa]
MEQRVATSLIMTLNEKKFIESALLSEIRVDGRRPFDYRTLTITFGSEDGSSEVQLGQTQVIGFVTAQLVQPYRDRPNEGSFSIYTEFSPMADPSFETGRPTDIAIELGRIIDRGLRSFPFIKTCRESRAVDTESLCVISGKLVWSIRIDLHIIDNGGNLVDAANIAALAALSTFRRPECTFGGEDGQQLIIHPPDVREPLPLIIHHLPIAVTFGFIGKENTMVIDPTHYEEAVMGGSMTATLNTNGDVCAIQKAGGEGVPHSVIMQCLRIASVKAADITNKIKNSVESYNTERSLRKVKRHNPSTVVVEFGQQGCGDVAKHHMERLNLGSDESSVISHSDDVELGRKLIENDKMEKRNITAKRFGGGTATWDPYSRGVDGNALRASLASRATPPEIHKEEPKQEKQNETLSYQQSLVHEVTKIELQTKQPKTLKDAVKPRHKRRNKLMANSSPS